MTATQLDATTALIVVDLQNGIVAYPVAHPIEGVIENNVALTRAFRAQGLPVVLVTVAGGAAGRTGSPRRSMPQAPDAADLIEQLDQQPSDHHVIKSTWGAFTNTDLDEYLTANGVTQVVVTGVATSAGVESTARHAHENGYNVTLAVDAMTDMNPDAHTNSVQNIFPRIGETATTAELLALLASTRA